MEAKQPRLDAPIPGMSLTHELGARPWQQPPQFPTVEDAVDHYTSRMMDDEFSDQLVDIMDMGIPLTTIANTIQLAGVMEGKHTVDVGLLLLPVLIETMMLIGDSAGVEYKTGLDDAPKTDRDSLAKRTIEKLKTEMKTEEKEEELPDDITDTTIPEDMPEEISIEEEKPSGLMARRN
jgi:hypothetical protein